MCEEAGPGACFIGQLGAGSFFGFFFGLCSKIVLRSSEWWGAVPGLTIGSCMGVMSARYPDGPPDASILFFVLGGSLCGTTWASYVFEQNLMMASLSGTTIVAAGMYFYAIFEAESKQRKALGEDVYDDNGEHSMIRLDDQGGLLAQKDGIDDIPARLV